MAKTRLRCSRPGLRQDSRRRSTPLDDPSMRLLDGEADSSIRSFRYRTFGWRIISSRSGRSCRRAANFTVTFEPRGHTGRRLRRDRRCSLAAGTAVVPQYLDHGVGRHSGGAAFHSERGSGGRYERVRGFFQLGERSKGITGLGILGVIHFHQKTVRSPWMMNGLAGS